VTAAMNGFGAMATADFPKSALELEVEAAVDDRVERAVNER